MSAHPGVLTTVVDNRCPHCGRIHDRATSVGAERGPESGDLSLCIGCGEWAVFGDDLVLRAPTDDEFVEIGLDADCRRARAVWLETFAQPPTPPASPGPGA